jgi:DNA-binding GntR family transcriptional regulator
VQDLQVRYLLLQRVEDHQHHGELLDLVRRRDVGAAQAWVTSHLRTVAAALECALEAAPARPQRHPAVREGA